MTLPSLNVDDRAYVFAVTRRILKAEDAANDATQDALLLAHRHRARFRGESTHRTWLHRIAVTTAIGYLRKQQRSREQLCGTQPCDTDAVDLHPSPAQVVETRELADRATALLGTIQGGARRVFMMRSQDASDQEIADALGITTANVKIRMFRVRHWLREQLAAQLDAP